MKKAVIKLLMLQVLLLCMLTSCTEDLPSMPEPEQSNPLPPQKAKSTDLLPDFGQFKDVKKKKEAFFNFMHPGVRAANDRVWQERLQVEALQQQSIANTLAADELDKLTAIAERYKLKLSGNVSDEDFRQLFLRIDVVPASLILAQAANESAWGTSRFAREGLNLFGIWCYTPGCGLTPKQRSANAIHEVRVFDSLQAGIAYYIHNLNSGQAYKQLRELRAARRAELAKPTGLEVAPGLMKYSERGQAYVDEISHMITQNELSRFLTDRMNLAPVQD